MSIHLHSRLLSVAIAACLFSCNPDGGVIPPESLGLPVHTAQISLENCDIPREQIKDGGPGVDGIPAIEKPDFTAIEEVDFLGKNELVLAFAFGGEVRIYPHQILDYHEIVNESIGDFYFSITYCPLTGTGIAWDRVIDGKLTSFGVSGNIFQNNLMPYDRTTRSLWSQLKAEALCGDLAGQKAQSFNVLEIPFHAAKSYFPHARVMNTNTGYNRAYGLCPYGDYCTDNDDVFYPSQRPDNRLPNKEKVLLVSVNNSHKVFTFNDIDGESDWLRTSVAGKEIIVIRDRIQNLLAAFYAPDGIIDIDIQPPFVFRDDSGKSYSLQGEFQNMPRQMMGYWFAISEFWPNVEIVK